MDFVYVLEGIHEGKAETVLLRLKMLLLLCNIKLCTTSHAL